MATQSFDTHAMQDAFSHAVHSDMSPVNRLPKPSVSPIKHVQVASEDVSSVVDASHNASTQSNIPEEFIPLLKQLLVNGKIYPWLAQFYHEHIKQQYYEYLDNKLFGDDFESYYQHPTSFEAELTRLLILKSYFTGEQIPPYKTNVFLDKLKAKIRNDALPDNFYVGWPTARVEGTLTRTLQNELAKAFMRQPGLVNIHLTGGVSRPLQDMIKLQILFYMRDKAATLLKLAENESEVSSINNITVWAKRAIANRASHYPKETRLKVLSKKHYEDNALPKQLPHIPNMIWYFLNGANRLPLFLQYEYLFILGLLNKFEQKINFFSGNEWKWGDLLVNLPMAGVRFFTDVAFIALLPYRLLRTFVNELTSSVFKVIRNMMSQRMPRSRNKKGMLFGVYYGAQITFYVSLLIALGLPIFPNPISWLPNGIFYSIPLITGSYCLSVLSGSFLSKLFGKMKGKLSNPEKMELMEKEMVSWQPRRPYAPLFKERPMFDGIEFSKPLQLSKSNVFSRQLFSDLNFEQNDEKSPFHRFKFIKPKLTPPAA